MTGRGIPSVASVAPLWQLSSDPMAGVRLYRELDVAPERVDAGIRLAAEEEAFDSSREPNIQLAPFRDRLNIRRQRYLPLQARPPWQTLAPLFASGQLTLCASGRYPADTVPAAAQAATKSLGQEADAPGSNPQWVMARHDRLQGETHSASEQARDLGHLQAYLHMVIADQGDLTLMLLPVWQNRAAPWVLSTLDGVGRAFRIAAQASFVQRIAQFQAMQLELVQEFAIRQSLYNALAQSPLRPSQALRYFDRLLDESPYPPSRTPSSDRLLQRRQLLQVFNADRQPTLWSAYGAVAQWVNYNAAGTPAQRWWSCCHGPGAQMLRQALAYAVALQYDHQDNVEADPDQPRCSGAERSLQASDALQARIQQIRDGQVFTKVSNSSVR